MLQASTELIQRLGDEGKPIHLICPTSAWATDRKLQAAEAFCVGVSVTTWNAFFANQWKLRGDARTIAPEALRRKVLITESSLEKIDSAANAQLPRLGGTLKSSFADELLESYSEVLIADGEGSLGSTDTGELSAAEQNVLALYRHYDSALTRLHQIDPFVAAREVALSLCKGETLVFEGFDHCTVWQGALIELLSEYNDVWCLTSLGKASVLLTHAQELQALASRLYTEAPGLQATGAVRVGEAVGPLATPMLIKELLTLALDKGYKPQDIALVLPDISSADPLILKALAEAGIPFDTSFTVPLKANELGAAVLAAFELATLTEETGDKLFSELLYALIRSPYFCSDGSAGAWELQREWRKKRALTHPARLEQAAEACGQPLQDLLTLATATCRDQQTIETLTSCLSRMLATAQQNGRRTAENLIDDRAAAQAIIDCGLSLLPQSEPLSLYDLEKVRVKLSRSFTEYEDALNTQERAMRGVSILSPDEIGLASYPVVIMGDLSAAHYPMSEKPSSLTSFINRIGVEQTRDLAHRQRATLLHLIESASDTFMFYRETFGSSGEESQESALWDELLANYHPAESEQIVTKPEEVPEELDPFAVRMYEGGELAARLLSLGTDTYKSFERGVLQSTDTLLKEPLSPTALESYIHCPYRWFVDRRLKVHSIDETFDALHKGSFAHEVLQHFYQAVIENNMERVTPANLAEALSMLDHSFADINQSYLDQNKQFAITPSEILSLKGLLPLLREMVSRDATFLPGFKPLYLETALGYDSPVEYAGVKIRGCIDRIDVNEQGEAVIIDYKSTSDLGRYGLKASATDLPWYLQGAIYARIAQRELGIIPKGSLFRSYGNCSTRGVFSSSLIRLEDKQALRAQGMNANDAIPRGKTDASPEDNNPPVTEMEYDTFLDKVEERVALAVEQIRENNIAPRPLFKEVCTYCSVKCNCKLGGASN